MSLDFEKIEEDSFYPLSKQKIVMVFHTDFN